MYLIRNEEGQLVLTTDSINLPFIEDSPDHQSQERRPTNNKPPPNADPRHRARARAREQVISSLLFLFKTCRS